MTLIIGVIDETTAAKAALSIFHPELKLRGYQSLDFTYNGLAEFRRDITMPIVRAAGKVIECESGVNLRWVLLKAGVALYNGNSKVINCRSIGSCGTCAVQIKGAPDALTCSPP